MADAIFTLNMLGVCVKVSYFEYCGLFFPAYVVDGQTS